MSDPMEAPEKKVYEISFLVAREEAANEILNLLKKEGAELLFEGPLRRISLAYKIKKEAEAYFGYFHFESDPERIAVLDRELKINPKILRSLIITPPFVREKRKDVQPPLRVQPPAPPRPITEKKPVPLLTNEALERKIEEILQ